MTVRRCGQAALGCNFKASYAGPASSPGSTAKWQFLSSRSCSISAAAQVGEVVDGLAAASWSQDGGVLLLISLKGTVLLLSQVC